MPLKKLVCILMAFVLAFGAFPVGAKAEETEVSGMNFCENIDAISRFLEKYRNKEVDEFNQLTICMAGDSIFGRVDKGNAWKEDAPEISYTPDMNDPYETKYGYQTGHFPPNMWEQTVPYKTLELLQWDSADVKYFNHTAAEVSKNGSWIDCYTPPTAYTPDSIRATKTQENGANICLTFSRASYVKVLLPNYSSIQTKGAPFSISFSTDGGLTWKTPEELGLTASKESETIGNGHYKFTENYKWGNICFKGLNKDIEYIIKVTNDSTSQLSVWGFETWSNPRINVVVTAEGGNTAGSQKTAPQRFYCEMYNPSLVIYELPFLNDLGTGTLARYKGKIKLSSPAPDSPVTDDFYYCDESGVYTNFGNISAEKGEYVEWNGTEWKIGSTKLADVLATYERDNKAVFDRIAMQGVPLVAILTHGGTNDSSRPFQSDVAMPMLRKMVGQYNFTVLDINAYQKAAGYYTTQNRIIHADGTHLNDKGVQMYMDLISALFSEGNIEKYAGNCSATHKPLLGNGTGGKTTFFGFEFSEIPCITIYERMDITVTDVTKSGFTTIGNGDFSYIAQISHSGELEYFYGDLNSDWCVNVKDAYYARLVAAKLIKPTEQQILLGDVDLDGKITALDANIIRKFAAKIITEIPV